MKKKEQLKRNLIYVLLGVLLLMIGLILIYLIIQKDNHYLFISEKEVSDNQSEINLDLDHHHNEEAYTELMGFGCLEINEDYPYIYLINPQDNEVYLSFDVYEDEKLLYSSDLIEPSKMEEFDIYRCLNAGKHTLVYSIASYDLDSKALLWSGIKQNQDISIIK